MNTFNCNRIRCGVIAFLTFICVNFTGQAQGIYTPSPDAMAMIRQANVNVNYYTGTSAVNIPLAELSGRELGVSVSLFYNSQGNKVQDIPSSEGLGWSLSAGGMITRIVRGDPDDLTNGYCTPNKSDKEPDLFIFNFLGRSGKFSLDANGLPVLFPYQDILIKPGICRTPAQTWEIVDENGVRYLFGETTSSRESTTMRKDVDGSNLQTYISTWYLSKIISPNGSDEISFSYTSGSIMYVNYFYTKDDFCAPNTTLKNESQRYTVSYKNINTITSSGGYIYFTWNSNREDIAGGKSLATIRVVNKQGDQVKKLRFEYGYFQASGCSGELCKRLRLNRIYDLSSVPLYEFAYNTSVNLPARNSKHFDHWGYYNNNSVDSWLPADPAVGLPGATRQPDGVKMKANILERISQRGGSYQKFNYEPHVCMKNGTQYTISGVRIQSIEIGDGQGNTYTKSYNYVKSGTSATSGILFRLPFYSVYLMSGNNVTVARRYSHSYSELLDVNGTHVGYSRVEESVSGSGKVVYTFTNYDTNPDITYSNQGGFEGPPFTSLTSLFWERGNLLTVTAFTEQGQPVSEELYEYTFNHPIKKQITGNKTMRVDHLGCGSGNGGGSGWASVSANYLVISKPFTLKKKTTSVYDQTDVNKKITSVEEYGYDPILYQLTSVTKWNAALPDEKYVTQNRYVTNPGYYYDNSSQCFQAYQDCIQTYCNGSDPQMCNDCQYEYINCLSTPSGDPMVQAMDNLRLKHVNNIIIEQQQWLNRSGTQMLLSATLQQFKKVGTNNNFIVPASTWFSTKVTGGYTGSYIDEYGYFVRPSSFLQSQSFNTYENTHARPTRTTDRGGIVTDYTYLYDNTLVGSITTNPGTNQQAVSYTYKPLAGVTQQTDANGLVVKYEYDAMSRLRIVRDGNNNIRTRLRYHYGSETPAFIINAPRLQAVVNSPITFSLSDIFIPAGGTSHVSWNMGNGTTYNDNRQSATMGYASAGTYTVSVTMTTGEYSPVTKSVEVVISNPLSISVCLDGPQEVDVCGVNYLYNGSCTVFNTGPYSQTDLHVNVAPGTGCSGTYSYYWEYKPVHLPYWTHLGSSPMASFYWYSAQPGSYEFRCTVTDACGTTATGSGYMYIYESTPGCTGGGGGIPLPPIIHSAQTQQTTGDEEQSSTDAGGGVSVPVTVTGVLQGTIIKINSSGDKKE